MSVVLGLRVGEAFAEWTMISSPTAQTKGLSHPLHHRWALQKQGLADGLKASLLAETAAQVLRNASKIKVSFHSGLSKRLLRERLGAAPTLITTSGFESMLPVPLNVGTETTLDELRNSKSWLPIERERVIGLRERVSAKGEVLQAVDLAELTALTQKLLTLKSRRVIVAFLHSAQNPENEKQVGHFLREHGLEVLLSSDFSENFGAENERQRFQNAITKGFTVGPEEEQITDIKTSLLAMLAEICPSPVEMEFKQVENESLCPTTKGTAVLNLGLEEFRLHLNATDGQTKSFRMKLQPTQELCLNEFGLPGFSLAERSFDPGPMCLGRSLRPLLIDAVLFCQGQIPGPLLADLCSSKACAGLPQHLDRVTRTWRTDFPDASWLHENWLQSVLAVQLQSLLFEAIALCQQNGNLQLHLAGPLHSILENSAGCKKVLASLKVSRNPEWYESLQLVGSMNGAAV